MFTSYFKNQRIAIIGLCLSAAALFITVPASAGDVLDWHATNIQALRGGDYKIGAPSARL